MKILAFGGLKGGSGKSTLCQSVAGALVEQGYSVTVIDADTQGTTAAWSRNNSAPCHVIAKPLRANAAGWKAEIQRLEDDYILLDLPPRIEQETVTSAALAICHLFMIPATPGMGDLMATRETLKIIPKGKPILLIPNRVHSVRSSTVGFLEALNRLGFPVSNSIGDRAVFIDAATAGQTVIEYEPRSIAAEEIRQLTERILKQ